MEFIALWDSLNSPMGLIHPLLSFWYDTNSTYFYHIDIYERV